VLISGRGSNMAALVEAARAADCPYEVVCVISDRADAAGLETARAAGIAAEHVAPVPRDKAAHESLIEIALARHDVELVALAGYMRILSPAFCARWAGRLVNIHPSLLPRYPGLDTHARAIAAGDREHGASVHLVTAGVDEGPVLAQARVPVLAGDTPEALAARVLAEEHKLYPRALADYVRRLG
jgi:formyltetrahydrofolate-dependent phosphoribosylglycinamide formyltransferase